MDIDQSIAAIGEANHGLFAKRHLGELHVSKAERNWRLTSGRWIELYDGVYRVAGAPVTWAGSLLAACWAGGPRAVASHRSAAALYALPGQKRDQVEITCPRWLRTAHQGPVVHESRVLEALDVTVRAGIPVTTVERTIFDLCAVSTTTTVDLAIDNALRRDLTTIDALVSLLRRVGKRGRKGSKRMRLLLADRDASYVPTDSEREQMLVRVLGDHGLPEPKRQVSVRDERGAFLGRVDLAYPDLRIAMEYDSYQHHVGKDALVRDSRRRNAMLVAGWVVLVATAEDVRLGTGARFAADVARARHARQLA